MQSAINTQSSQVIVTNTTQGGTGNDFQLSNQVAQRYYQTGSGYNSSRVYLNYYPTKCRQQSASRVVVVCLVLVIRGGIPQAMTTGSPAVTTAIIILPDKVSSTKCCQGSSPAVLTAIIILPDCYHTTTRLLSFYYSTGLGLH